MGPLSRGSIRRFRPHMHGRMSAAGPVGCCAMAAPSDRPPSRGAKGPGPSRAGAPRPGGTGRPGGSGRPGGGGRPSSSGSKGRGTGGSGPKGQGSRSGARPAPRSGSPADPAPGPRQWGSLARKGARRLDEDTRGAGTAVPDDRRPEAWEPEEWVDEGPLRDVAEGAVTRGRTGATSPKRRSEDRSDVDVGAADERSVQGGPRRSRPVCARPRRRSTTSASARHGRSSRRSSSRPPGRLRCVSSTGSPSTAWAVGRRPPRSSRCFGS